MSLGRFGRFFAVILLFGNWAWAEVLTLGQTVETALKANPGVEAARLGHLAASSGRSEAKAFRWPQIKYSGSVTRSDDPVYVFGSLLRQGQFAPEHFSVNYLNDPPFRTNFRNALEAGIPIYTGNELSDQIKLAEFGEAIAAEQVRGAELSLRAQLISEYLTWAKSTAQERIYAERIASAEKELNVAQSLMKRGLVLGSDYYAALGILEKMKAVKIQAAAEKTAALNRILVLSSLDLADWNPQGTLAAPTYELPEFSTWRAWATNRPDQRIASLQIDMAARDAKKTSRTIWPDVTAFGVIETNTEDFSSNPSHSMGGIKLESTFGDPGFIARNHRASYQEQAVQEAKKNLDMQTDMDLRSRITAYQGAKESALAVQGAIQNATESLRLFRPLYREGRQSVLEVIRAEQAVAEANAAWQNAVWGAHQAYLGLTASAGRLNAETISQFEAHMSPEEK